MHTPIRFRDGGDALERELLASVDCDQAPSESRARVALQLGLVGLASSTAAASLQAAKASSDVLTAAPDVAAAARWLHWSLLKKVLLVGFPATLALVAGLWLRAPARPQASVAASPAPAVSTLPAPSGATAPVPEPVLAPEREASLAPRLSLEPRALPAPAPPRTTRQRQPAARAVQSNPLLAEVAQLDHVRAELRAERSAHALSELAAYEASFPAGQLAIEAAVLRVQALLASQDRAAAVALARRTLERPGSERYRAELQRLLAASR